MKYIEKKNTVILYNQNTFEIDEILECGQCFRFIKIEHKHYTVVAHNKLLHIEQSNDVIKFYPTNIEEFEKIWINYFDLNTDYKEIKEELSKSDPILKEAIDFASGIRILNQDTWECIISFIISQNNRIPMIKKVITNMCEKYGEFLNNEYSFPTYKHLTNATEEELMLCKTGFRAKYILDAINKVNNNIVNIRDFKNKDTLKVREILMNINGIGPKVSDCILLFGCSRKEVFPTDVWVKRVMEHYYFNGENTNIKDIHYYAQQNWGDKAGFAQQYLFHYARQQKIGMHRK